VLNWSSSSSSSSFFLPVESNQDGLYSTVVADENNVALGLVYSSQESIKVRRREEEGILPSLPFITMTSTFLHHHHHHHHHHLLVLRAVVTIGLAKKGGG